MVPVYLLYTLGAWLLWRRVRPLEFSRSQAIVLSLALFVGLLAYPLGKMVCVARYHGLVPLAPADAFSNMGRDSIIEEWGSYLRKLGYDGALVVHPKHVPIINRIFSPSREDIDAALEMRDAIAQARAANKAAVIIGGKLIEKVNIDIAARTLAIAEKLGLVDPQES